MSHRTEHTWICDACEKVFVGREGTGYHYNDKTPKDPWLSLSISGHWMSPFGDQVKQNADACSPECAVKLLEKAAERLKSAPKLKAFQ